MGRLGGSPARLIHRKAVRRGEIVEAPAMQRARHKTPADVVRDPSDLGALAVLNSYCYDYLKGIAHDVYLESQMWSIAY